ncbi:MAG: hypothetical protein ACR2JW_20005 [Thermomicrobiales bacterium]
MPDQPTDTNKNAIKVALAAALGSALGIITAVRSLTAGKRAVDSGQDALTPQPPSPVGKGEPDRNDLNGIPRNFPRVPPPVSGGRVPSGQMGVDLSTGQSDWERLPPAHLPRPTYWPVVLAFAVVLLAWGVVTTLAISVIGALMLALALGGWIGELRHGHE